MANKSSNTSNPKGKPMSDKPTPKFYVATYSNYGIQVEFFTSLIDYNEAVNEAEEDHRLDRLDTYSHGEVE